MGRTRHTRVRAACGYVNMKTKLVYETESCMSRALMYFDEISA